MTYRLLICQRNARSTRIKAPSYKRPSRCGARQHRLPHKPSPNTKRKGNYMAWCLFVIASPRILRWTMRCSAYTHEINIAGRRENSSSTSSQQWSIQTLFAEKGLRADPIPCRSKCDNSRTRCWRVKHDITWFMLPKNSVSKRPLGVSHSC
jgi:hypothetical protein